MNIIKITVYVIILTFLIFSYVNFDRYQKMQTIEKFSRLYNTRIWETSSTDGLFNFFPEKCLNKYFFTDKNGNEASIGIAYSGGGPRSYTCMIGYLRALSRLGLYSKTNYVSSVSGGSWFHGTYSYAKSMNSYTDAQLLGESLDPKDMTEDNLKNINFVTPKAKNLFMGARIADADIVKFFLEGLTPGNGVPIYSVWSYAIGKIFLEIYNINDNVPVTLNTTFANQILVDNNINMKIIKSKDNDPFWICNTTLLYNETSPVNGMPLQYPYIVVPMTSLYSGIFQRLKLNDGTDFGGYVTETYAFNTESPDKVLSSQTYNVGESDKVLYDKFCSKNPIKLSLKNVENKCTTLRDMIGTSSTAYGGVIYNYLKFLNNYSVVNFNSYNFIPIYKIWTSNVLKLTNLDSQCSINLDGTCGATTSYDPISCERNGFKCYSKSAPQCTNSNNCSFSFLNGRCMNINNGSTLGCRYDGVTWTGIKCTCINPVQQLVTDKKSLLTKTMTMGDGGFSDNSGILSLVARGVTRVVSFNNNLLRFFDDNGNTPVDSNGVKLCDRQLPALFGIEEGKGCDSSQLSENSIQIFYPYDYPDIINQLKTRFLAGGPTFARKKLKVMSNVLNGVKGGYEIDLLLIVLQPSTKFLNLLPASTKNAIIEESKGTSDLLKYKYSNFPNYSTILPDIKKGIVELSKLQVNLLSSFTDWQLMQPELRAQIIDIYS